MSGDWRAHGGRLELIAALVVNVAGFSVPRTQAVAASGVPQALVAAGVRAQPTLQRPASQGKGITAAAVEAAVATALRPFLPLARDAYLRRIRG